MILEMAQAGYEATRAALGVPDDGPGWDQAGEDCHERWLDAARAMYAVVARHGGAKETKLNA